MTYGRTWANTVGQAFEDLRLASPCRSLHLAPYFVAPPPAVGRRRRFGVIAVDEFTGQYLEGRGRHHDGEMEAWVPSGPAGKSVAGDLESRAEDEGAGHDNADAESALARYEAGGQGWSAPDDAAEGEDTFDTGDLPGEGMQAEDLAREGGLGDDLPSTGSADDLLRLEEDC